MSGMENRLRERLTELRSDFAEGRRRLEELEGQARAVQHALLRISGAIQVLEEELARSTCADQANGAQSDAQVTTESSRPQPASTETVA